MSNLYFPVKVVYDWDEQFRPYPIISTIYLSNSDKLEEDITNPFVCLYCKVMENQDRVSIRFSRNKLEGYDRVAVVPEFGFITELDFEMDLTDERINEHEYYIISDMVDTDEKPFYEHKKEWIGNKFLDINEDCKNTFHNYFKSSNSYVINFNPDHQIKVSYKYSLLSDKINKSVKGCFNINIKEEKGLHTKNYNIKVTHNDTHIIKEFNTSIKEIEDAFDDEIYSLTNLSDFIYKILNEDIEFYDEDCSISLDGRKIYFDDIRHYDDSIITENCTYM